MKNVLKNKKGETLVETLMAILVFTMASIALYAMVSTATSMNIQTSRKNDALQEQLIFAEKQPGSGTSCYMTVSCNGLAVNENAAVYQASSGASLYSYSH